MRPSDPAPIAILLRVARRALVGLVPDEETEDLCQETVTRVLAAGDRVAPEARASYTWVVARNLGRAHTRRDAVAAGAVTRLANRPDETVTTEDVADLVGDTDRRALRRAMAALSPSDRAVLAVRDVHEAPAAEAADLLGVSPGTLRVRLHRARCRLRVRYAVARRGAEVSDGCLAVLDATVQRDRLAMNRIGAEQHVAGCDACRVLAADVHALRRPTVVIVPLLGVEGLRRAWRAASRTARTATATTAAATVVTASLVVAVSSQTGDSQPDDAVPPTTTGTTLPAPAPASAPLRTTTGVALLPVPSGLQSLIGEPVVASAVPVDDVVADEAFWVGGPGDDDRILVVVVADGESPQRLRTGATVSFQGTLVGHDEAFPATVGVDPDEGADLVAAQGTHVLVPAEDLVVG